ncbi:MAG: glycogen/starch synthase [Nanoarchaeota archaeon]|nr:glycogen/starch synthase [Nanoarchaeota archaeon]MBU1321872.1 glycogen/starch synthase [Nanoarchaeota archaeon]MBU1597217.1 glycogen/starch synthase [Nanoarchaeota archaeon]MBU2441916.1 glycogen/starch synthase [Nanoarchaeota archaeon]
MVKPKKEKKPALTGVLAEYEKKYIAGAPAEQKKEWQALKSQLEDIISTKKAPGISKRAELPLILLATPEIILLPSNMGNLVNVIATGDGGGVADISGALAIELNSQGLNVHVALPEYKHLFQALTDMSRADYELLKREIDDHSRIHLVADDMFSAAKSVYDDQTSGLEKINLRKANAFQRGVISRILPELKTQNNNILVHCNDWMTGLIPAAAKSQGIMSLMTLHNTFTYNQWPKGLHKHSIDIEPFWEYIYFRQHPHVFGSSYKDNYEKNEVDFMTSGLFASDFINTVSPTFLKELVEGYFHEHHIMPDHMRDVIRHRFYHGSATGILNAPLITADPRKDPEIVQKYWHKTNGKKDIVGLTEGKQKNKLYFQQKTGLEVNPDKPLFFWPSRLSRPQKGFELLLKVIPGLMQESNMQIAVVANGDPYLIYEIRKYQEAFNGRVSYIPFSRQLSQIGKAGADFILMPSLYEPCGIPQVEAPRYGTIPVVRRTGGLADTVQELSTNGFQGNGFLFDDFLPSGLNYAIRNALNFYSREPDFKEKVQARIMDESFAKFNIKNTADQYIKVYQEILDRNRTGLKVK